MAAFLLVHGSCHGAWCWRDVLPALAAAGHRAEAIDLPAHGEDRTPAAEATLAFYAERVAAALEALGEPAVLVGHSAGGATVTMAAERVPERIERLVYLCAYALKGRRIVGGGAAAGAAPAAPPGYPAQPGRGHLHRRPGGGAGDLLQRLFARGGRLRAPPPMPRADPAAGYARPSHRPLGGHYVLPRSWPNRRRLRLNLPVTLFL